MERQLQIPDRRYALFTSQSVGQCNSYGIPTLMSACKRALCTIFQRVSYVVYILLSIDTSLVHASAPATRGAS